MDTAAKPGEDVQGNVVRTIARLAFVEFLALEALAGKGPRQGAYS